jgi:glutamine synthetase
LATDTGVNLLSPSKTNEQFTVLNVFYHTIKAVNDYEALLRGAIATASNDHRLGANEAPPAIISFIGEQLTKVLAELKGYCGIIPEENRLEVEK